MKKKILRFRCENFYSEIFIAHVTREGNSVYLFRFEITSPENISVLSSLLSLTLGVSL